MTRSPGRYERLPRDAGLTLIEALISLTILALLLALVPSTLRLGKRAWETAAQVGEADGLASLAFARSALEQAMPLYEPDAAGLQRLAFSGDVEKLAFVSALKEGPVGGGLYRIEIGAIGGPAAGVRITPYRPRYSHAPPAAEVRDASRFIAGLRLRYFGAPSPGAEATWQTSWHADRLPDLVEISTLSHRSAARAEVRAIELKMRPIK